MCDSHVISHNRVVSHPTLPITITAHEDRHIRFFDNNTGELDRHVMALGNSFDRHVLCHNKIVKHPTLPITNPPH